MKKIIVTGNSGKTLFSYFLAEHLSKDKKVVLISTDEQKATFRCLFPNAKKTKKSLARLLSDPVITDKDIYQNASLINKRFLMITGGDYTENFPDITTFNCVKLLTALEGFADIVIVDSSKHIFDNFIAKAPDCTNICITTADIRGHHFRMKEENGAINVLWQSSPYGSYQDALTTFKEKPFELPYEKKLTAIYNGEAIKDVSVSSKYKKTLKSIAKTMEELEVSYDV